MSQSNAGPGCGAPKRVSRVCIYTCRAPVCIYVSRSRACCGRGAPKGDRLRWSPAHKTTDTDTPSMCIWPIGAIMPRALISVVSLRENKRARKPESDLHKYMCIRSVCFVAQGTVPLQYPYSPLTVPLQSPLEKTTVPLHFM